MRGSKLTTSDLSCLDISKILKKHNENPSHYKQGPLQLYIKDDNIHVEITEKEAIHSTIIEISTMPCNYGGVRYFGLCPFCKKRVKSLYLFKILLMCRHCLRLCYRSQNATLYKRLNWQWKKIGNKINHDEWTRPKWMRKKTFKKLRNEYFDLDEKSQIADIFSLKSKKKVDQLFEKYSLAIIAAEVLLAKFD